MRAVAPRSSRLSCASPQLQMTWTLPYWSSTPMGSQELTSQRSASGRASMQSGGYRWLMTDGSACSLSFLLLCACLQTLSHQSCPLSACCRENIEKDIELERKRAENPDLMEDDVDAVPCITRSLPVCSRLDFLHQDMLSVLCKNSITSESLCCPFSRRSCASDKQQKVGTDYSFMHAGPTLRRQ